MPIKKVVKEVLKGVKKRGRKSKRGRPKKKVEEVKKVTTKKKQDPFKELQKNLLKKIELKLLELYLLKENR